MTEPILRVDRLVKRFGGLTAVDGVSFSVRPGEIFGLIGPNGSGKTTLFDLISGFHRPTAGSVRFDGRPIDGMKPNRINKLGLARTFQVVRPLKRMTVLENTVAAAFSRTGSMREATRIAEETLEFCDLAHRAADRAGGLTIGDRKRLEIVRGLATGPKLILLDETFAGLNPVEQERSIELIRRIGAAGVTVVIVEHIMKVIMAISDRIHAVNFGRTIAEGSPAEVAAHPEVVEAYLGGAADA